MLGGKVEPGAGAGKTPERARSAAPGSDGASTPASARSATVSERVPVTAGEVGAG